MSHQLLAERARIARMRRQIVAASPPDEFVGPACAALSLGNVTAQEILGMLGAPPPSALRAALVGNIRVF